MASTKPIANAYTSSLDLMTNYIKKYMESNISEDELARTYKSISDFCFNNSHDFTTEFLSKVKLHELPQTRFVHDDKQDLYKNFLMSLVEKEGECVFLLKDTYKLMEDYVNTTGKGFGVLINRNFLCDNDEDKYFLLVNLTYETLKESDSIDVFLKNYRKRFSHFINKNQSFYEKAFEIYQFTKDHVSSEKIIWVDFGFQFTFCLFCYMSVSIFSDNEIKQDFFTLTCFTWLQEFFSSKYFSKNNELVLDFELEGIAHYNKTICDKSIGVHLGFAIGDSLGFPAAGINFTDLNKMISLPINNFYRNPSHPYFSNLKEGQYTENTNMLLTTSKHLISNKGYDLCKYCSALILWYQGLTVSKVKGRWAGPTAIQAIEQLLKNKSPQTSGSKETNSCSALYRIIPLAIYFRFFKNTSISYLRKVLIESTSITHNTDVCHSGSIITGLIIADLLLGREKHSAIRYAVKNVNLNHETKTMIDNINFVLDKYTGYEPSSMRAYLGTGSPIDQTLPLALYYFLKFSHDSELALIEAANSYRNDSFEEKIKLSKFNWEEQLIYAKGGNTDGIAALTGAFCGAYSGTKYLNNFIHMIENYDYISRTAEELVK